MPYSSVVPKRTISDSRITATVFTVITVAVTALWQAFPNAIPLCRWDGWVWFVCCGAVLLSVSRFSLRHPVPGLELWLLAFPLLFAVFFKQICPTTRVASLDELLWSFDANFGYPQPSLGRFLVSMPLFFWLCKVVWWSLPFLFVVLYLALPASARRRYLMALVLTGCLILPLYALCPGAGPVYLFRGRYPYPDGLPMPLLNPHKTYLAAGLALNTTPSGHVAWALLLLRFAYSHCGKAVAVIFGLLLGIMAVATLGLGEHYVIDLILSVPYMAAIWALVHKQWRHAGGLLGLVIAWLILLRQTWASILPAPVIWLLCAITIACCFRWQDLWKRDNTLELRSMKLPAAVRQ
jgi:PAP2 superfamily protein